jgi:phage/plasmid-associated DNA primase
MLDDTKAYRHEQDVVGRFIDEESVQGEEFTSPKKFTYECFKDWAEDAGEHYIMTQVEFNEKMLSKFAEGRSKSGRFWRGFKLKTSGVTAKPANGGHFKTGQRKWPRTRLFYSEAS